MVAFLVSSCYSERFYEGDGNLKDSGFWVIMGNRYILSLKEVDLSKNGIDKPEIFGPLTLLGFRVVDSYLLHSSTAGISQGSCRPMSRVV